MKVYIAGKITGDPNYKGKFAAEAEKIRAAGHIALNPAELPEGMEPGDYMRICFAMIDVADAWSPGPEQDYQQDRLDRALKDVFGEELQPFKQRYPFMKEQKYRRIKE